MLQHNETSLLHVWDLTSVNICDHSWLVNRGPLLLKPTESDTYSHLVAFPVDFLGKFLHVLGCVECSFDQVVELAQGWLKTCRHFLVLRDRQSEAVPICAFSSPDTGRWLPWWVELTSFRIRSLTALFCRYKHHFRVFLAMFSRFTFE